MCKSILRMVRLCLMVCSLSLFVGCKEKPIHHAAYDGDLKKVKEIIDRDPNQVNVQDAMDFTPLHLASGKGHTEIVEFLLNHGADTELETCIGLTPMILAARYARDGKYETIKTLLEHGAKVNHKEDVNGGTALHYAAMYSGKEVINLLISYGADVNAKDIMDPPLGMAGVHSGSRSPDRDRSPAVRAVIHRVPNRPCIRLSKLSPNRVKAVTVSIRLATWTAILRAAGVT